MGEGRGANGLTLDPRALGRATLARQHLLARSELGADQEIEHLVGMQSQIPTDPYVAQWSRLAAGASPGSPGRPSFGMVLIHQEMTIGGSLHRYGGEAGAARSTAVIRSPASGDARLPA